MRILCLLFLASLTATFAFGQTPNCDVFDGKTGPFITSTVGTEDHINGAHIYTNSMTGKDTYTGSGFGVTCSTTCTADSSTAMSEGGLYSTPGIKHVDSVADANGIATGLGAQSASAQAGGIVDQCPLVGGCTFSVGVEPFRYTGSHVIRTFTTNYANNCPKHTLPTKIITSCDGCGGCPSGETCVPTICQCNVSPIAIDVTGNVSKVVMKDSIMPPGVFSDTTKQWVTFDLKGNGQYGRYSFPLPGSGVYWLVLRQHPVNSSDVKFDERDNDRTIDSGKELFGSYSPHANWMQQEKPSAWQALNWYDQPANGGVGIGVLNKRAKIWDHLALWEPRHCFKDMNAPCAATEDELYSLQEKGIESISLVYTSDNEVDTVSGVQLGSFSLVNVVEGETQKSHDSRIAGDFWVSKKQHP